MAGAECGEGALEWENIIQESRVHWATPLTDAIKLQSPSLLSTSSPSSSSFPLPRLLSFKAAPPFVLGADLLFRAVIPLKGAL